MRLPAGQAGISEFIFKTESLFWSFHSAFRTLQSAFWVFDMALFEFPLSVVVGCGVGLPGGLSFRTFWLLGMRYASFYVFVTLGDGLF